MWIILTGCIGILIIDIPSTYNQMISPAFAFVYVSLTVAVTFLDTMQSIH